MQRLVVKRRLTARRLLPRGRTNAPAVTPGARGIRRWSVHTQDHAWPVGTREQFGTLCFPQSSGYLRALGRTVL